MAMRLETPSRIWARIEQAQDEELPSLPSMPAFEDSAFPDETEGVSIQHSAYYPTPAKAKSPSVFTPTPRPNKIRALSTPRSAGEVTARAPIQPDNSHSTSSIRSRELSIDSLPEEYLPPPTEDDEELSMSLTDALESVSRAGSPEELGRNDNRAPAPHKSLKDIYNDSHVSAPDADITRRSNNLSAHIKPSPRARIPAQAPSPIPTLTHSPRSVTSASSQHTPTLQRLPLSPAQGDASYGSVSDRSRHSAPASRPTSRVAQSVDSERDISYDSLPKEPSQDRSALQPSRSASVLERSLSQSRPSARPSPKASLTEAPPASESEITYDSVSAPSLGRSRSSPGQRAVSETPAPVPSTSPSNPTRRAMTQSPAPSPAQPRARFPVPQTPGNGLDSGVSHTPAPAPESSKLSRSFMMQVVNSAVRPTVRPKGTPFAQGRFQTPAVRRLSEAVGGVGSSSFVSTASSHDLAIHPRINASFDAISHARGGGGEFDQRKLRTYLQSLNKHLSEENAIYRDENFAMKRACLELIERLAARGVKVDRNALFEGISIDLDAGEDGVERDPEIEVVEDLNEELVTALNNAEAARTEIDIVRSELEAAQADVIAAREEVVKVTEQCDAQIAELEDDVQQVIGRLQDKLKDREAEAKKLHEQLVNRSQDGRHSHEDALTLEREQCARLEGHIKELEEEVAKLDDEGRTLKVDLRDARAALRNEQVGAADAVDRVRFLENEALEWEAKVQGLEQELEEMDALEKERDEIANERDIAFREREQITRERDVAVREREDILDEKDDLLHQCDEARKQVADMETALENAESRILDDAEQIKSLRGKITSLERERAELMDRSSRSRSDGEDRIPLHEHEALVSDIERQLDDAHREIARLTTESPAASALAKAKDIRIEQLEKEKEVLAERIQVMRSAGFGAGGAGTPGRVSFTGGTTHGTPLGRLAMMNLKTPRTPGAALRDPPWMNQSTMHGLTDPEAIHARLLEVDARLAEANESIDDKLDKLEKAGAGTVSLTTNLHLAKEKITGLERELAHLGRREERLIKKLQRCRCAKCHMRFDASAVAQWAETSSPSLLDDLMTEPPTPETKTSRNLQAALSAANSQLENLRTEWQKLGQENEALRGAGRQEAELARQAEAEMKHMMEQERKRAIEAAKNIKDEKERERALADMELDQARNAIAELEEELRVERSKLRSLATEHARATRDKAEVLAKLERTNQDVDSVKSQLERYKNNNKELEMELRSNATAETKARRLEARLQENNLQIENLRAEREILTQNHEQLRKRFEEITERAESLRQRNANSQAEHEKRQHRLDMQVTEVETLRALLAEREAGMKDMATAMHTARGAQSDAERVVRSLQAELKRVKSEADQLGTDIEHLKLERGEVNDRENDRQHRARTQAQVQMRALNEQLQSAKDAASQLQIRLKDHGAALRPEQVENLKKMHNKECKGLMVQIRYLKDKFYRESLLRQDVSYQKKYLIQVLDVYSKSDEKIERALARPGFPHEKPPTKTRKSLKSVASAILFIARAQRLGSDWREKKRVKPAINAALEEVRRHRTAPSRK